MFALSSRPRSVGASRRNLTRRFVFVVAAAMAVLLGTLEAAGETAEEFYKDKRLTMISSSDTGGGYDGYARLAARHLPRYLPGNPTFVVQNMPGAGGLQATNHLYNIALKDGTVMAGLRRGLMTSPLLEARTVRLDYDPMKFSWLISLNAESGGLVIVRMDSEHRTADDLLAKELTVGSSGSSSEFFPLLMKNMLDMKLKIIAGYKGSRDAYLALERGEVEGRISTGFDKDILTNLMRDGKVRLILALALRPSRYFPDLPLVTQYAKSEEHRQVIELLLAEQAISRPFVMPPDVPADRIAVMRRAFMDVTKDATFLAEAERLNLDIDPVGGEEMMTTLKKVYATPPDVVETARALIGADKK